MIQNYFTIIIFLLMTFTTLSSPYYDDYFLPDSDSESSGGNIPRVADDEGSERPTGYTCGLCVVVDEEFSKAYNVKDPTALKNSVQRLVDHANWVFRAVDWNGNGRPDNIGFRTVKISYGWKPYKHESTQHYNKPKPALELLKIFARVNFTKCCLGVGFTNRLFMYGMDGISFGASDRLLGGICDHRNPHEDFMANMNVVLISGRVSNTSQLTSYQIAKALVHELGHAFGVHSHDNDYRDPQCWGFRSNEQGSPSSVPTDGRYIMWEKSSQSALSPALKKNTLRFSSCSKTAISNILKKRKNRQKCFDLDFNPFCGNGIVEGLEMCDCGNEYDCQQQKCCGSRKSETPCVIDTKVCGLRRSQDNAGTQNKSHNTMMLYLIVILFLIIN